MCYTFIFTKFKELEDEGCLNSLNEIDINFLHFFYIPRINSALKAFVESWNNHPISTERNYIYSIKPVAYGRCTPSKSIPYCSSQFTFS